jgi:hypothetical protein
MSSYTVRSVGTISASSVSKIILRKDRHQAVTELMLDIQAQTGILIQHAKISENEIHLTFDRDLSKEADVTRQKILALIKAKFPEHTNITMQ